MSHRPLPYEPHLLDAEKRRSRRNKVLIALYFVGMFLLAIVACCMGFPAV